MSKEAPQTFLRTFSKSIAGCSAQVGSQRGGSSALPGCCEARNDRSPAPAGVAVRQLHAGDLPRGQRATSLLGLLGCPTAA
jgi:hypothetical protein